MRRLKSVLVITLISIFLIGCANQSNSEIKEKKLKINSISTAIGAVYGEEDNFDRQLYSYSFFLQNDEDADLFIEEIEPVLYDHVKEKVEQKDYRIKVNKTIPKGQGLEIKGEIIFNARGMTKEKIVEMGPFIKTLRIKEERNIDFLHQVKQ